MRNAPRRLSPFLLASLLVVVATSAHALVLCAPKKSGQGAIKARTACNKREVQLDPVALGLKGPAGNNGTKGVDGTDGTPGVSGYEIVTSDAAVVFVANSGSPSGLSEIVSQACPAGKTAVAGGADISTTDKGMLRDITVVSSRATADGAGWEVQLFNKSTSFDFNAGLTIRVACAVVAP